MHNYDELRSNIESIMKGYGTLILLSTTYKAVAILIAYVIFSESSTKLFLNSLKVSQN